MSLGCSSPARPAGGVAQHCPGGRDVTRALGAVWARASPELLRSRASRRGADGGDARTDMDVFLTAAGGFHRVSQVNLRFTHRTSVLWSISSPYFCLPCPLKLTLQAPGRTSWSFICISTQPMDVCVSGSRGNKPQILSRITANIINTNSDDQTSRLFDRYSLDGYFSSWYIIFSCKHTYWVCECVCCVQSSCLMVSACQQQPD